MEVKYRINGGKDYGELFNDIVDFSADYIMKNNLRSAILGISGGIDSTVVAAILHETTKRIYEIDPEYDFKFFGYSLPTSTTNSKEHHIARMVGWAFCSQEGYTTPFFSEHDITDISDKVIEDFQEFWGMDKFSQGNIKARLRMMYLYNKARENKGFVVGTDNYTEMLLGFSTIGGDALADYMPLQYLWKTDVYGIARYLVTKYKDAQDWNKVAAVTASIEIPPQDGLGISNSDMDQIGAKNYFDVDHILYVYENYMAELIYDFSDFIKSEEYNVLTQMYGDAVSNVIMRRRKNFKLNLPIVYKHGWRT